MVAAAFMDFVGEWWPVVAIFYLWSLFKHGPANIAKYKRWDKIRAARRGKVGRRRK